MLDRKRQTERADTTVSAPQYQVLLKFLSFSARPETGGQAVEDHLLTSLAFAAQGARPQ